MAVYLTATEFRNITNLQSAEYSDNQLTQLITSATAEIDKMTGRTWQGSQTVTDEYYDGDGTNELQLNHVDVSSLDALSVDVYYDGNYVSVDTDHVLVYSKTGTIILDNVRESEIEATIFTKGNKTVKVSYKYGNSAADNLVKNLCALIVLQELRPEEPLQKMIDKRISLLRANSITIN